MGVAEKIDELSEVSDSEDGGDVWASDADSEASGLSYRGPPPAAPPAAASSSSRPPAAQDAPPRLRGGDYISIRVPGGYLVWSEAKQTLDAHCRAPGHVDCKVDRSLKPSRGARSSDQGRPAGRHMAWLQLGLDTTIVADKEAHQTFKKVIGGSKCLCLSKVWK